MWTKVCEFNLGIAQVRGDNDQRGGALLPDGSRAPKVEQGAMPYGSGTSAVTLPISSNSVFEVYSFTEIVP